MEVGDKAAPWPFSPRERDPVPMCRRQGGSQGRSGLMRKVWLLPEFGPWTFQPVASRYTD